MIQFYRDEVFEYNGVKSDDVVEGLRICYVGDSQGYTETIQNGLDRSVNFENNSINVSNSNIKTTITLALLTHTSLTDKMVFKINKWLEGGSKVFKPLVQKGYIYYAIFTNGQKWLHRYEKGEGYLTFNIELLPYMYSPILEQTIWCSSSKNFQIENNSNIDEFNTNLNIQIKTIGATYVSIENLSNGTCVIFNDLSPFNDSMRYFEIIGEDLFGNKTHIVENKYESDKNILDYMIRKNWITLKYGVNNLRITSNGKVEVKFRHRDKIQIM